MSISKRKSFELIFFLLISQGLFANSKTLYSSLDPQSIPQHLALYQLFPETSEGQAALNRVAELLGRAQTDSLTGLFSQRFELIDALVGLINRQGKGELKPLSWQEIREIQALGKHLPNRRLYGYTVNTEEELLSLPPEEIDLAHAIFLFQYPTDEIGRRRAATYEALIDLMALQILARLSEEATPAETIAAINQLLFFELGFRFPPHSEHVDDIDLYTFLPSVLDSRRGVCLGVTIVFLSLAQRLRLPLEIITPPGHIFLRYADKEQRINIETTARGIHVDDTDYLGLETRALPMRNLKEVVGLAFFNAASPFWKEERYCEALDNYQRAKLFLPEDPLLNELMAYNYLFIGETAEGKRLLRPLTAHIPEHAVSPLTVPADYLAGAADVTALKVLFNPGEEGRDALVKRKAALEEVIARCPKFRATYLQLAVTHLQLHQKQQALAILEDHHQIDSEDPHAELLLTMLYFDRRDYRQAWKHYAGLERLLDKQGHKPKDLGRLRQKIFQKCPSCTYL